ncbi:MAG: transposase, partial [Planctomycetes bacterium]|nr:transposase [Planctomycetota bacterium]
MIQKTLDEFEARFSKEEACRDYLFQLRWQNGFRCPRCGHEKAWSIGIVLFQCGGCNYQMSVIAGTIFQDTHKPLTMWF